jgi:hypothetical protein
MVEAVSKKAAILALIIGALMLLQPIPAFAAAAFTSITCADPEGNQVTRQVGWDNENIYFNGKGDIPRLYCEGGHAGIYTTYISDTLEPDSPLRYFNGVIPVPTQEPTPTPEPSASPEPSLEPTPEPTPSQEPLPSPTIETPPSPTPEITPEPTPTLTEIQTPSPEPTPKPQTQTPTAAPVVEPTAPVEPEPVASVEPVPDTTLEATPLPAPSLNPQVQTIELPEALQLVGVIQLAAAAEAIMNVGADMTEEEREESQIIAVAAIIVSQIAGSIRRMTK